MFKSKKIIALIAASLAVTLSSVAPIHAAEICDGARLTQCGEIHKNCISVVIDGKDYTGEVFLISNTAYVSLREFASFVDSSIISWDEESSTACVWTPSLTLTVRDNADYIEANGRAIICEHGSFVSRGRMYVPLRPIADAFGFSCDYFEENRVAYLRGICLSADTAEDYYDADELYWLSRIIEAEAGGEPFEGMLAVGSVIANRAASSEFPDSIVDVIFDTAGGVQFSPVANGMIYNEPCEDAISAAKLTLDGYRVSEDALFFLNQKIAESMWIVENCTFVMTIGNHDFYS